MDGLRKGRYSNEAAVSQGVVMRILAELGWPAYDTDVVWPEFKLDENRRVDFALCHPSRKPRVLIEVKQPGLAIGAERQLFEYAFHAGIPMAILTDGPAWSFFLPAEVGSYGERRVYKLDFDERSPTEVTNRLERYLSYARVCSGESLKDAREDYASISRDREIAAALPEAWASLLGEEDPTLIELLADEVESRTGYRPDSEVVAAFLRDWTRGPNSRVPAPPHSTATPRPETEAVQKQREIGTQCFVRANDQQANFGTATSTMIEVFRLLGQRDHQFFARFMAPQVRHGRNRRYLADEPEKLYPSSPHLTGSSQQLAPGVWIGTNYSKNEMKKILKLAFEIAGPEITRDIRYSLGD